VIKYNSLFTRAGNGMLGEEMMHAGKEHLFPRSMGICSRCRCWNVEVIVRLDTVHMPGSWSHEIGRWLRDVISESALRGAWSPGSGHWFCERKGDEI
jgi:hypothetical protein